MTVGWSDPARYQIRSLKRKTYLTLVAIGLGLAGMQLLLLPRLMSAHDFGLLVLGISATQAGVQFGDLGLGFRMSDTSLTFEKRASLRLDGHAIGLLVMLSLSAFALVLAPDLGEVSTALGIGVATAALLQTTKVRAKAAEAAGDQRAAALHNLVWQNAPKLGMLGAALLQHSGALPLGDRLATGNTALLGGLLSAAVCGAPRLQGLARIRYRTLLQVRGTSLYLFGAVGGYAITWADTYFVAAHSSTAGAGSYEATYRLFAAVTYLYLPLGSSMQARLSVEGPSRVVVQRLIVTGLLISGIGTAGIAVVLAVAGHLILPGLHVPLAVLPLLACTFTASAAGFLAGNALIGLGRAREAIIATGLIGLLAVLGHVLFTLRFGAVGAASVDAFASILAGWIQYRLLRSRLQ